MRSRRKKSTPKIIPKVEPTDAYASIVKEQFQTEDINGEIVICLEDEGEPQRRCEEDCLPEVVIKIENPLLDSDISHPSCLDAAVNDSGYLFDGGCCSVVTPGPVKNELTCGVAESTESPSDIRRSLRPRTLTRSQANGWELEGSDSESSDIIIKKKKTSLAKPNGAARPFSCDKCELRFSRKIELIHHGSSHAKDKRFACDQCDYRIHRIDYLLRHLRSHTGEPLLPCALCAFSARDSLTLTAHELTHTEKFVCDVCDYKCLNTKILKRHQRVHRGEKPYHCDVCDFSSGFASSLKTHMRKHTDEKPYSCTQCSYRGTQYSALYNHKKSQHSAKVGPLLRCDLCQYRTRVPSALKLHKMIHNGAKPFGCALCDYRTNKKIKLVPHLRRHYGWRPFKCKKCNWRFIEKSELKVHMRVHLKKMKNLDMSGVQRARSFEELQKHKAQLNKAVESVKKDNLPLKTAARLHSIPYATLHYRIFPRKLDPNRKKTSKSPGHCNEDPITKRLPLKLNPSPKTPFKLDPNRKKVSKSPENCNKDKRLPLKPNASPKVKVPFKGKRRANSAGLDVLPGDLSKHNGVANPLMTFVGERDIRAAAAKLPKARVLLDNILSKQDIVTRQCDENIPPPSLLEDDEISTGHKERKGGTQPETKTILPPTRLHAVPNSKEREGGTQPEMKPILPPTRLHAVPSHKEREGGTQPEMKPILPPTLLHAVPSHKEREGGTQPETKPILLPTRLHAVPSNKVDKGVTQPDTKPILPPTRLHAVPNHRPYNCKTCSFEAATSVELEEHRKFHPSLPCGICDFRSGELDDLKIHVMAAHIM